MKNRAVPAASAALLAVISLLLLFGPLLHMLVAGSEHSYLHVFHHVFIAVNVISLPVVAILLLYIAIYVYYQRALAILISGGICIILLFYLPIFYGHGKVTPYLVICILSYLAIITIRFKDFAIKNNTEGLTPYLIRIGTITVFGFIYGFIGFFSIGSILFHTHFSFLNSMSLTLDSLTGFSGSIPNKHHLGDLFIDSLGGIGITIFALLLETLFRPLRLKVFSNKQNDREKAAAIIQKESYSSEDFFKLWPEDKNYYFSESSFTFLAYKQSGQTIVILGDPVGRLDEFANLISNFIQHCFSHGWQISVINATQRSEAIYKEHNLSSLFIGSEGIIDVQQFMSNTITNKHFRYVNNKAKRDKLEVKEWHNLNQEQFNTLSRISRSWLHRGGRREYTFFMGYFSKKYLEKCRIFVLLQDSKPVAYINLIPSFYKQHESLDHMRSQVGMSSVGMHFLMMKIVETLEKEDAFTLNIGLSPLSGIHKNDIDAVPRTALRILQFVGSSYYSFQGLEQFKNKFEPTWQVRSLIYSGPITGLVRISRDVERASALKVPANRYVYVTTIAGIGVLTLGIYFILG